MCCAGFEPVRGRVVANKPNGCVLFSVRARRSVNDWLWHQQRSGAGIRAGGCAGAPCWLQITLCKCAETLAAKGTAPRSQLRPPLIMNCCAPAHRPCWVQAGFTTATAATARRSRGRPSNNMPPLQRRRACAGAVLSCCSPCINVLLNSGEWKQVAYRANLDGTTRLRLQPAKFWVERAVWCVEKGVSFCVVCVLRM